MKSQFAPLKAQMLDEHTTIPQVLTLDQNLEHNNLKIKFLLILSCRLVFSLKIRKKMTNKQTQSYEHSFILASKTLEE